VLNVTADPKGASMDADLDLLLSAVYVTADDLLPERPGNAKRIVTDAEVVTLCVAQAIMGIPSDRRFLAVASKHLRHLFPSIPAQAGYFKRRRRLVDTVRTRGHLRAPKAARRATMFEILTHDGVRLVAAHVSVPVEASLERPAVVLDHATARRRDDQSALSRTGTVGPEVKFAHRARRHTDPALHSVPSAWAMGSNRPVAANKSIDRLGRVGWSACVMEQQQPYTLAAQVSCG
jgi:hypothetical protein